MRGPRTTIGHKGKFRALPTEPGGAQHGRGRVAELDDPWKGDCPDAFLATVERVGNMVPHPAIIFFILIGVVIVLSVIFGLLGTTVTYDGYERRSATSSSRPPRCAACCPPTASASC